MKNGFTLIEMAIVIAIVGILVAAFLGPYVTCKNQATAMGVRYQWGFFKGCLIEPKTGQWVPLKNYRVL